MSVILEILYKMPNSEILNELKISVLGNGILKTKEELRIYLNTVEIMLWTEFTCSFLQMHPSFCISN